MKTLRDLAAYSDVRRGLVPLVMLLYLRSMSGKRVSGPSLAAMDVGVSDAVARTDFRTLEVSGLVAHGAEPGSGWHLTPAGEKVIA